jgi:hypothetical protein
MPLTYSRLVVALMITTIIGCGPPPPSGSRGGSRGDAGPALSLDAAAVDASGAGRRDAGQGQANDTGVHSVPDAGAPPLRDAGPAPCSWPTRNLGNEIGQSLPSNLAWQGLGPGESRERRISIEEFFDCDGARGIHAVMIVTSQYGCSRCTSQASGLTQMLENWRNEGLNIQVLTLKIENPNNQSPASMDAVNHWRNAYNLTTSYVGYDNSYTMVPRSGGGRFGTPLSSIIDPRTMEVIDVIQGFDNSYRSLLELARQRAAER